MSRHVVKKYRGAGTWAVLHASSDNAGSGVPWARVLQLFDTWREAMDYADRMARTVEVVLSRIAGCGDRVPGAPGLLLGWENHIFWLADHGSDFIRITPAELRPLAAALLALAEKEELR